MGNAGKIGGFGKSVSDPLIDRGFSCWGGSGSLPELLHPGKRDLGFRGRGSDAGTDGFRKRRWSRWGGRGGTSGIVREFSKIHGWEFPNASGFPFGPLLFFELVSFPLEFDFLEFDVEPDHFEPLLEGGGAAGEDGKDLSREGEEDGSVEGFPMFGPQLLNVRCLLKAFGECLDVEEGLAAFAPVADNLGGTVDVVPFLESVTTSLVGEAFLVQPAFQFGGMGIERSGIGTGFAVGFKGSGEDCAGGGFLRSHHGWSIRIWMFPDPGSSLRKTGPIAHDSITAPRTLAVRGADCFENYAGVPERLITRVLQLKPVGVLELAEGEEGRFRKLPPMSGFRGGFLDKVPVPYQGDQRCPGFV